MYIYGHFSRRKCGNEFRNILLAIHKKIAFHNAGLNYCTQYKFVNMKLLKNCFARRNPII